MDHGHGVHGPCVVSMCLGVCRLKKNTAQEPESDVVSVALEVTGCIGLQYLKAASIGKYCTFDDGQIPTHQMHYFELSACQFG